MSQKNSIKLTTQVEKCIFCLENDAISEEHIISAWVFRALDKAGIEYEKTSTIFHTNIVGEVEEHYALKSDDATSAILCEDCNKIWGNILQNKASAILKPFVIGGWNQLTEPQLERVRRWFTSHLMVREFHHEGHETHTQEERKNFRTQGHYPKNLNVWMAPIEFVELDSTHRPIFIIDHMNGDRIHKMHILVQCLGHIVFVSYGGNLHKSYGVDSLPYLMLSNHLSKLGFVQIMHPDKKFKVNFPSEKPKFFGFPGEHEFCDEVTQRITDIFDDLIRFRRYRRNVTKLLKLCSKSKDSQFILSSFDYRY